MKKFYFDKWLDLSKILSIEYGDNDGWECFYVYMEMLDSPIVFSSLSTRMLLKHNHDNKPANKELRREYNKLLNDWQSL